MKNLLTLLLAFSYSLTFAQLPDLTVATGTSPTFTSETVSFTITFRNDGNATSPSTEAMPFLSDENDDDQIDYFDPLYFDYPQCTNTEPVFIPSLNPGQSYTASFTVNVCEHSWSIAYFPYTGIGAVIDWENLIAESNDIFDDNSGYFANAFNFNNFNCSCPLTNQCIPVLITCSTDYDPVCGCNNTTYTNECEAEIFGIYDYTSGECDCSIGDIECGETKTYSTINSGNNINAQDLSCVSSGYAGNDLIVKFERTSSYVTNWITLWNYSREDIDIFIVDECSSEPNFDGTFTCLEQSTNVDRNCSSGPLNYEAIEFSGYPAGTYYIIIDGKSSNDTDNQIFLSLSCEGLDCNNNITLTCNNPINSNNNTANRTSNYYSCYIPGNGCYDFSGSWTGGERIFKFTAPEDGDYSFCMNPTGNIDLELFLFTSCCSTQFDPGAGYEVITDFECFDNCDKAATLPSGETETINNYPMNAGQMIWLVVDGFLGDEGNFTIEAKCNNFDCDDLFELRCGLQFDDSNVATSNTAANTQTSDVFDTHNLCNQATDGCKPNGPSNTTEYAKNEVAYYLDGANTNNKDIVIDIFPRISNLDVDLFVYEDCNNAGLNDCEGASTWGAQEDDSVILFDVASSDEFFVIVDGQSNNPSGVNEGRFGISVTCGKITDHNPTPIECGTTINGNTSNSNNWISHYCNCPEDIDRTGGGNNGKEDLYVFDISTASDITITLDQFGNRNLELYLLNALDVKACYSNSRNTTGTSEQIQAFLNPGTYYIIVEGHDGDEGIYQLSLEGCDDNCALMENIFCEDFQNYTGGQFINLQSNNWNTTLNSNDQDCKVVDNGGAKSLLVDQDNFIVCSSLMEFNDNTNADLIELSFDIIMPYYNFGSFPLKADGAEIYVLEKDASSQDFIYMAFRPHSSSPSDDRRVCLNVNNVYESDGCSSGSGELFPFNRNTTNKIKVRLQKSTGNISVFINDNLLGNAPNSGINELGAIGFRGVFNENSGFLVDNICLDECKTCPGDVFYVTDEVGNSPCNDIGISGTSQSNNNNLQMTFNPGASISGEFIRWEIRDVATENVITTNTSSSNSFNYCCFTPGQNYYICYYYKDANDCIQFCCIRIDIPNNCAIIQPRFNGNTTTLSYQLSAENLLNGQTVLGWYDSQSNSLLGTNQQITYIPPSSGTRYICCLIYDSINRRYLICCRQICIENPYTCNTISAQPNSNNSEYTLSAPSNAQDITWFLDAPTSAVIGFNNPQTFRLSDFNVPLGSPFQVSYRYRDATGCWRFCCKNITPMPPANGLTLVLSEVCGPVGSTITVPITVRNFDNIAGAGFTVSLENNFARLTGMDLIGIPGSPLVNILSPNRLVVAWANGSGTSLPDGALFANIQVEILGNGLQSSDITISNDPAPIDFQNANNQSIPVTVVSGEICLATNLTIEGNIAKDNSQSVSNVTVNLSGGSSAQTTSNTAGNFSFEAQANQNYTVTPSKDGDDRNGVNISDLLRVQKHLVFIERFDKPSEWIAADLDNNKQVTISDLILLQRLLVFLTPEFEFVDSWKFVDRNFAFPNNNVLNSNYPQSISYNPLTSNEDNTNFMAIKMGDIDGSASGFNTTESAESRMMCTNINIKDHILKAGQTVDLQFTTENFSDIAGFLSEIKFELDKLEYVGFVSSDLQNVVATSFSEALIANGYLIASWFSPTGLGFNLPDDSNLHTLRFKVLKDTEVSDAIFITNDNLNSEYVDGSNNTQCIELEYNLMSSLSSLESNVNISYPIPNPFSDETRIQIDTNVSESIILKISNTSGQLISKKSIQLNSGHNTITINNEMLNNGSGLYIYTIESDRFKQVGRIIQL